MQDIKLIKENPELFKKLVEQKHIKLDIDDLLQKYEKRNELNSEIESLRSERNKNVEEIKKVKGKPPVELVEKGKDIKEKLSVLEANFKTVDDEYQKLMWFTPQVISEDTPIGVDDSENVEVKRWSPEKGDGGDPKKLDFEFKDHITLGEELDILEFDRGVKTSGFRGYYLKNEAMLLHMGLMMFGIQLMKEKGFDVFTVPTIVKSDALWGSGHFPFDEENVYVVESMKRLAENEESKEKKYLVGTAEPSLLNYFRDEVIDEADLPIKVAGCSQCYRSEVGSYGRDTKGIYRIHEFMKVEQVVICKNDFKESDKMHQAMISYSEELLKALKIPYRVIQVCTGDMGAGKYKMFDIESWMPSRNAYGETHSASNLADWQPRRLNIKVKDKDGNRYYPHALNNTVVASPRILIAVLENYQNADGTITVPEVLRQYVGVDVIKPKK